jgi:hypothetical protein
VCDDAVATELAALRDDFAQVLPHLVAALKRDEAVGGLLTRLDVAERKLEARSVHPLVLGVVKLLHRVRQLQPQTGDLRSVETELLQILSAQGLEEFGRAGEAFDPLRHRPLVGVLDNGAGVVSELHSSGFEIAGQVVIRADVSVASAQDRETVR